MQASSELEKIERILVETEYQKVPTDYSLPYAGKFFRYEKKIDGGFKVSIDILFEHILDRQTDSTFTAEWVFENSSVSTLKGKTVQEKLRVKIVNVDALLVMKIICCRLTDIRDVFMIIPNAKKKEWILEQINLRTNVMARFAKLKAKVASINFKGDLRSIYGGIDDRLFEKHKNLIFELEAKREK